MRLVLAVAACLLIAAPATAGTVSVGPFAGLLEEGGTAVHHYQNAPDGAICIALAQPYTITVASSGPVTVSVPGAAITVDGVGSMTIERGVCTQFDITVVSGSADPVAYAIDVMGGPAAGGIVEIA